MTDDFPDSEVVADLCVAVWGPASETDRARAAILSQDATWKVGVLAATVAAVLDPIGGFRLARILAGEMPPEGRPRDLNRLQDYAVALQPRVAEALRQAWLREGAR